MTKIYCYTCNKLIDSYDHLRHRVYIDEYIYPVEDPELKKQGYADVCNECIRKMDIIRIYGNKVL